MKEALNAYLTFETVYIEYDLDFNLHHVSIKSLPNTLDIKQYYTLQFVSGKLEQSAQTEIQEYYVCLSHMHTKRIKVPFCITTAE